MTRWLRSLLVVAGAATVIAGFMLPWVQVDADQPQRLQGVLEDIGQVRIVIGEGPDAVTVTSESLKHFPVRVRGHELPRLSARSDARLALKLLAAAADLPEDLPGRLQALYAVPIAALVLGALLLRVRFRWFARLMGVCCLAAAVLGVWAAAVFRPEVTFLEIRLEAGPWIALGGYVVLALAALIPPGVDRPSGRPI